MKSNLLKKADWPGKNIRLKRAVMNGAGFTIPEGAICKVVSGHYGLTIEFSCECCGVKVQVSHVDKNIVEVIKE